MASSDTKQTPSRCIFVGSIPYDATEENLIEIFQEVGPVLSFRLVFDRETGKPKGFGFCEYHDVETALSAMRNLQNYEISGRCLRLDFAESEKALGGNSNLSASTNSNSTAGATDRDGPVGGSLTDANSKPGPAEIIPGPAINPQMAPEAIIKLMKTMQTSELYEFLRQLKQLTLTNMEEARSLLTLNPQLAYACLQSQLYLGLVDPTVAQNMLQGGVASSNSIHPPVEAHSSGSSSYSAPLNPSSHHTIHPVRNHPLPPQRPLSSSTNPQAQGSLRPASLLESNATIQNLNSDFRLDAVAGESRGGDPRDPRRRPTQNVRNSFTSHSTSSLIDSADASSAEKQKQLLRQVMSLTQQQIDSLPTAQKQSIIQLREQM
eukprot:Sdes_comp18635_c0_seq1m8830